MSLWYQVPAYTRRGDVLIHLSGRAGAPPPPYELQGMVSDGEFNQRMSEVQKLLRRYSWSALERIFLVAVVLMSIVVVSGLLFKIEAFRIERWKGHVLGSTKARARSKTDFQFYTARHSDPGFNKHLFTTSSQR